MKNLTEFKRAAKVGSIIRCIFHKDLARNENGSLKRNEDGSVVLQQIEWEPREITIVQTNSIAMKTKRENGEVVNSWFQFPKAADCVFEDGKMTVLEESREGKKEPVLTYWFEKK